MRVDGSSSTFWTPLTLVYIFDIYFGRHKGCANMHMSQMTERNTIFSRSLIRERIKILPKEIGSNIRDVIMAKLQGMLEGVCTRHGYVRPGSIKIHELSPGRIEGSSLNGDIIYHVSVVADVCNPATGHVLPARIVNSNKFGLLAHSCIEVDGKHVVIVETVITRHNYHGGPTDVPLDTVRVGDDVFVEVLGKTFELLDTKISVAGRLLRAVGGTSSVARRSLISTAVVNPDIHASDSEKEDILSIDDIDEMGREELEVEERDEDEEEEEEKEEFTDEEEDDGISDVEEVEDEEAEDDFEGMTADDDDFSSDVAVPVVGGRKRS